MKVNWDDDIPNIWENKIDGNQTHQPDYTHENTGFPRFLNLAWLFFDPRPRLPQT